MGSGGGAEGIDPDLSLLSGARDAHDKPHPKMSPSWVICTPASQWGHPGDPKPQPSALCGFLVSVSPMVTRGPFLGCEGWMWLTLSPRCPPQVWDEANRRALELAEAEGWVSIHPFDHPLVW